jgi:hypothetical protein
MNIDSSINMLKIISDFYRLTILKCRSTGNTGVCIINYNNYTLNISITMISRTYTISVIISACIDIRLNNI